MGLWLKCPGCQAQNSLSMRVCPHCGQDLSKLAAAQRVYVIGPAAAPPPEPAPETPPAEAGAPQSAAPPPEAGVPPAPAKKPKRAKKKKS